MNIVVAFIPIESVEDFQAASAIAELNAFIAGEFSLSELACERDLISQSYINYIKIHGTNWDNKEYFEQEPETCFQEARLKIEGDIEQRLHRYQNDLKEHYPFEISGTRRNVLIKKDTLTPVGLAYVWLRFYELYKYNRNYVQFADEEKKFKKAFEKIFEFLAIFAVAGKCQSTAAWVTGRSRSAGDYLAILEDICEYTKEGKLKNHSDLTPNQKTTNDGRVDGIVITEPHGSIKVDSQLYLIQATIQKSDIKSKTVTDTHRNFFNSFFLNELTFTKIGLLIIPHFEDPLHRDECKTANCDYIPLERIYGNMGDVSLAGKLMDIGNEFVAQYSNIETY